MEDWRWRRLDGGRLRPEDEHRVLGHCESGTLYDWGGADWKTKGARPGDNLYTTSVIALDPDTGKLKSYFQELPHDAWDFDSAVGEFVMLERGGKEYIVHPNKGGFVFVYDRNLKVQNVWQGVKNINFVKSIDPKTGELVGRRDLAEGKHQALCPYIAGGYSWNSGSYNPVTGLYYKVGNEWCMDLEVIKTTPILEPMAQLNIGSNFAVNKTTPDGGKARGHVSGRDPITGAVKWRSNTPSRRWRACYRQKATSCSCPTRAAGCTRLTPAPAPSCGSTTTARDTTAASSATWRTASSTSRLPPGGADSLATITRCSTVSRGRAWQPIRVR